MPTPIVVWEDPTYHVGRPVAFHCLRSGTRFTADSAVRRSAIVQSHESHSMSPKELVLFIAVSIVSAIAAFAFYMLLFVRTYSARF